MNVILDMDKLSDVTLASIARDYGYEDLKYLVLDLTHIQNINIENVTNYLKDRISSDLEGFKYYNFEEYVVLLGNNVFFVNNNTKLTDEETEYLRALSKPSGSLPPPRRQEGIEDLCICWRKGDWRRTSLSPSLPQDQRKWPVRGHLWPCRLGGGCG